MNEIEILDPNALQRLQRLGGGSFVIKMIDLFFEYAGDRIAEARVACDAGNAEGVERAVHPVKSSAGNVGAIRVQQLAQRIETMAQAKQQEALETAMLELERAFEEAKGELREKRQALLSEAGADH